MITATAAKKTKNKFAYVMTKLTLFARSARA